MATVTKECSVCLSTKGRVRAAPDGVYYCKLHRPPGGKRVINRRTGRAPGLPVKGISLAQQVKNLKNETVAMQMRMRGVSYAEIARTLDVDPATAKRFILRATEELRGDHMAVLEERFIMSMARVDEIHRAIFTRALGQKRLVTDKFGRPVTDPFTGKQAEETVAPDIDALKIITRLALETMRMRLDSKAIRIETTGADGGPIVTAAVDSMEAARLVREAFGAKVARVPSDASEVPRDGGDDDGGEGEDGGAAE